MADLIDRISGESEGLDPPRPKINLHRFMGLERLYVMGVHTRLQISTELDLQGDEVTQATQLADEIDAQADQAAKFVYIARVESVCMCLEDHNDTFYHDAGVVDKATVYSVLNIAG